MGYPRIHVIPPAQYFGGRVVRSVAEKLYTFTDCSVGNVEFTPERRDGGAVSVALSSGLIIDRRDGYRARVTLSWKYLALAELVQLVEVFNYAGSHELVLQPHNDNAFKFRVRPEGSFYPTHIEDLYVGHAVSVTFIGAEILDQIPSVTITPATAKGYHMKYLFITVPPVP